jgi:hypothetical protein
LIKLFAPSEIQDPITLIRISPNERLAAFATSKGILHIAEIVRGKERLLLKIPQHKGTQFAVCVADRLFP